MTRGVLRVSGRSIGSHPGGGLDSAAPRRYRKTATVLAVQTTMGGVVETPEGEMEFEAGDYLVTDDPPTHAWPVRRAVFEATHEALR